MTAFSQITVIINDPYKCTMGNCFVLFNPFDRVHTHITIVYQFFSSSLLYLLSYCSIISMNILCPFSYDSILTSGFNLVIYSDFCYVLLSIMGVILELEFGSIIILLNEWPCKYCCSFRNSNKFQPGFILSTIYYLFVFCVSLH